MTYYIGTLQQCEDYDRQVVIGEGYGKSPGDVTTKYAIAKKHPTEDKYAILAHPSYQSDMEFVEQLSEDWNPQIDENLWLEDDIPANYLDRIAE